MSIEQVAVTSGVPVATVRTWSRGTVPAAGWRALLGVGSCDRCGGQPHNFKEFAEKPYLYGLGIYLGDGTIHQNARCTSLRIACDPQYRRSSMRWPRRSGCYAGASRIPRYQFSNRSDDIRRLFTDACDLLDIAWRRWGRWHISVARRDSVAKLDEFVGLKA